MQSSLRWHQSLAARSGVVFVLFVVAGSCLLLVWLRHQQEEESARVFFTLAETDARFVRRLNLPRSAKLAGDLQQLLGLEIYFRDVTGQFQPALPGSHGDLLSRAAPRDEIYKLPNRREALIVRVDEKHDMIFVRATVAPTLALLHPATLSALVAFGLLSALLAWVIAGQVLRPLGTLTRRLPGFFANFSQPPETVRKDEIGQLARALTHARDELAAERVKREQSERLALLGRVATGLAHDIKNPLASIQLHAELLTPPADAESAASVGWIRSEAKVIEGLVNQWLYLARPGSPRLGTVDIGTALAHAIQSVRGQADYGSVTIEGPAPGAAVAILGDGSRLEQAFRNLLINAIQAMSSGGLLKVVLTLQSSEVAVTFEDSGPGFSALALERGTDLFYSEKEGGMGVGLNVVSEIISAHQGRMMLKNRPSGGGLVELSLPLRNSLAHSSSSP